MTTLALIAKGKTLPSKYKTKLGKLDAEQTLRKKSKGIVFLRAARFGLFFWKTRMLRTWK
jgi:hypothetical protein